MVLKIKLTKGTMMRIILSMLSRPLAGLSSRLKMLREMARRNSVYARIILLRRISTMTYLMTLNKGKLNVIRYTIYVKRHT